MLKITRSGRYRVTRKTSRLIRSHYRPRTPGSLAAVAGMLGWPKWAVQRAVRELGLQSEKRSRWTPEEDAYLQKWLGVKPLDLIAQVMRKKGWPSRSPGSVATRAARLGLSVAVREGYSEVELGQAFGVSATVVRRWIALGYLAKTANLSDNCGNARVSEEAVVTFVRNYPLEFDLKLVSQTWFLGMVLPRESSGGRPCQVEKEARDSRGGSPCS